ncbi:hypothetical protein [Amorphus orientalis]|uniref:Uncharacterized protein n=1 Tax=Amorphus orientalis TaxID=649198 RepID=A0AAE3VNG0_9HYPH|nr:hypothetical protein [Amorphus orientalis]MDQ0314875.1 hypothetical protein [Amorphus orientalis]
MRQLLSLSIVILVAFFYLSSASAKELDGEKLEEIRAFATKFCGEFYRSGSAKGVELGVDAKAEIDSFLKKYLSLGLGASAQYKSDEYIGVLQEDLASELSDIRDCKLTIWRSLIEVIEGDGNSFEDSVRSFSGYVGNYSTDIESNIKFLDFIHESDDNIVYLDIEFSYYDVVPSMCGYTYSGLLGKTADLGVFPLIVSEEDVPDFSKGALGQCDFPIIVSFPDDSLIHKRWIGGGQDYFRIKGKFSYSITSFGYSFTMIDFSPM